ncbi:transcription repressor MYB6-like [Senna tora]|uniref:Transcription repressor MYB6-like n=1 Tax=Senna tora TaxID=362788 RepID=A0A834W4Z9_9FABA|nr:transcription repressor MYB6-like [Senna tora]
MDMKKGGWSCSKQEHHKVYTHGQGCCRPLPQAPAGLHHCGKSCRVRWIKYERPEADIKRGNFAEDEQDRSSHHQTSCTPRQ